MFVPELKRHAALVLTTSEITELDSNFLSDNDSEPNTTRSEGATIDISDGLFALTVDCDDTVVESGSESGCAAEGVTGMLGGADLAVLLAGLDLDSVSAAGLVDTAAGWERIVAWATAQQLTVLAEAARPGRVAGLDSCVAMAETRMMPLSFDEVAKIDPESAATVVAEEAIKITAATLNPIIGSTRNSLTGRIHTGIDLITQMPATFAALAEGRCDYYRALLISRSTQLMNQAARAKADLILAAAASSGQNYGKLRHTIDRTIAKLDPVTWANRHRRAIAERSVSYRPGTDGMGIITAVLRAEDAITIYQYLSALGQQAAEADQECPDPLPDQHHTTNSDNSGGGLETLEPRTAGACRAYVLVDLVNTLINTGTTNDGTTDNGVTGADDCNDGDGSSTRANSTNPGVALVLRRALPRLNITMSLESLAHVNNDPAWLDSYGHIPADYARHLATSAGSITVTTLDNCGTVLVQGTAIQFPNQKLKTHIQQRDRTCRAPGCNQPANKSDLDHQIPHRPDHTGGPTCPCNMAALCRTHHLMKHRTNITITPTQITPSPGKPPPATPTPPNPTNGPTHPNQTHTTNPPTSKRPPF